MYRNSYQRGMLTVFFSVGSKPLAIWDTHTQDGYITRFLDQDIKSMVLEIGGTNVSTTFITCPKGNKVLGITMPFLVMIVKNLKKYFSFEVTILDETLTRRRFRVSNFQSTTQILPLCTVMPIGLSDGWNQIQFNLAEFTRRAYKKQFVEVQKLKINANIRLRRIYFTERLIPDDELPPEYKLYFPLTAKGAQGKKTPQANVSDKENVKPPLTQQPIADTGSKSSKASIHSTKKTASQIKTAVEAVENVEKKQEEESVKEVKQNDTNEEFKQNKINEEVHEVIQEVQNEENEEVQNEAIEGQNEANEGVQNEAIEGQNEANEGVQNEAIEGQNEANEGVQNEAIEGQNEANEGAQNEENEGKDEEQVQEELKETAETAE